MLLVVPLLVVAPQAWSATVNHGGVITNYTGTGISDPNYITAGPDGALWFTNLGNDSIGRITTSGIVTNYTGAGIGDPYAITVGPDGAVRGSPMLITTRSEGSQPQGS